MVHVGTAKLVYWVLIGTALCIVVGATSMAYIETLYIKAQIKKEIKALRKLKQESKEAK